MGDAGIQIRHNSVKHLEDGCLGETPLLPPKIGIEQEYSTDNTPISKPLLNESGIILCNLPVVLEQTEGIFKSAEPGSPKVQQMTTKSIISGGAFSK